jgi:hypothetical protein
VSYFFHPEAAMEYAEQVAHYKSLRETLGGRYHAAVKATILKACMAPGRYRIELAPDIRQIRVEGFPYSVIFRESNENIQILGIAHHRRRPLYWSNRI